MSAKPLALITAGAAGLGFAIAKTFSNHGHQLLIVDSDPAALDQAQSLLPEANVYRCDLADSEAVSKLFATLTDLYQRLDCLVNNVGIAGPNGELDDISVSDWDRTLAVNLSSAFYTTRLALPLIKAARGSIINISSTAGLFGCPNRSPYVASKWALIGLTKSWAMEYGKYGIRVNAICPGSVEGPRINQVIELDAARRGVTTDHVRAAYEAQTSLNTFVAAEDVANMALFLAGHEARFISGQALAVDGNTETLGGLPE